MCQVVVDALRERREAALVAGERVNLGQRLHHEAGVKVVDEVAHAVDGVVPGAVGILGVENEVEVALGGFADTRRSPAAATALVSRNARYAAALITPPPSNGVYEQDADLPDTLKSLMSRRGVPRDRCQHLPPFIAATKLRGIAGRPRRRRAWW